MGWGADGSAFAVTGALFLMCGAIASGPRVRARLSTLLSILVMASASFGAAFLARAHGGWVSSPSTWSAALLPLALIAFFVVRASRGAAKEHSMSRCLAPQLAARRKAPSDSEAADFAASSRLRSASDPTASGTELADLAYAHPEVRVAIAANPATPANVLGWLASTGGQGVADAIALRGSEGTPRTSADGTGSPRDFGA